MVVKRTYLRLLIAIFQKQIGPRSYKLIKVNLVTFAIISLNLGFKTYVVMWIFNDHVL